MRVEQMNNPTATSPLDEKIFHSLKLLSRSGGDYRKDERTFIAETLKELAILVVDKLG